MYVGDEPTKDLASVETESKVSLPVMAETPALIVKQEGTRVTNTGNAITGDDNLIPKDRLEKLKAVVAKADDSYKSGSDEWWTFIINFQNAWNEKNQHNRITNSEVAKDTFVTEETVKNKRSELGLSKKRMTRSDLK